MDGQGIEPWASRKLSGCDTTTPTTLDYETNLTNLLTYIHTSVNVCIYFLDVVYRAGLVLWLAVVPAGKCGQKLWETRGMNKQIQKTIGLQGAGETNSKQQKLEEAKDIARNNKTQVSRKQQTTGPQTTQPTATITTTLIRVAIATTTTTNNNSNHKQQQQRHHRQQQRRGRRLQR